MSNSPDAEDTKPVSALSILDQVLQFRYALLVASAIIAIDIGRIPLRALGFPDFNWFAQQSSVPMGTLIVFVGAYLFFMAVLSPVVQVVFERLWALLRMSSIFNRIFSENSAVNQHKWRYLYGYVRVNDAETLALEQRDAFWIKRVNEHREKAKTEAREVRFLANVSFSCTVLAWLDWQFGEPSSWIHVAMRWPMGQVGALGIATSLLGWVVVALVAFPWLAEFQGTFDTDVSNEWIKHPELASEHAKKIESNRRAQIPHQHWK